jgi:protease PrsW
MKLKLKVLDGSLSGQALELLEGTVLLGRSPDCDFRFHFETDRGVSKYHAKIESRPGGFYLADLRSTNGTLVNGKSIQEGLLHTRDVIQLGTQGPQILAILETEKGQEKPPALKLTEAATTAITRRTLYKPEREKDPVPIGIYVGLGMSAFMALVVIAILVLTIGFAGTLVGFFMAFLPAPFYLLLFIWLDRYDPEPPWALAAAFAWGALFSIFISFILNSLFGSFAASFVGEPAGLTLSAIFSAPLVEEGSKGLGIVLIMIFLRREFDGILDGIVYAGVVALGFATMENVLYYGKGFGQSGGHGLLLLLFLRGVLSPFAHSLFTSATGIGCGISRETHQPALRWIAPIAGYGVAVMLHSLWNTLASFAENKFLFVYFGVWVPLFLIFISVLFYVGRRERLILRQMLAPEVAAGLLSTQQLDILSSTLRRISWLLASLNNWKQLRIRQDFLRAAAKLGFCYWHASRAAAASQNTISLPQIPKFRKQVAELQKQI